ncbi:D-alanyl-D-alanine carboxypeptidase family protein [Pontibacillus salicampi]
MMRKCLLIVFVMIFLLHNPVLVQAQPNVSARNAVLMEQTTGRVLLEKQAHEKRKIASITKVMTAIIAIESGKMEELVTVSKRAVYEEGSSIYLEQGEEIKLKDLVYGLMLRSGNDAATAIAEHVGGSLEGFAFLMNQKAEWIGMNNSHFDNPHGLDSDEHYSTAYDMALLTRYAMNNDVFKDISQTKMYKAENRAYAWGNKNKMLTKYYEYSTGGKTGFTKAAGRTLISTAKKEDMELIMVTLNGPDDWNDHRNAFEWGYKNYKLREIQQKGKVPLESKDTEKPTGYLWEDISVPLTDEEFLQLDSLKYVSQPSETEGVHSVVGRAALSIEGKTIIEAPVMAERKPRTSFVESVIQMWNRIAGTFHG